MLFSRNLNSSWWALRIGLGLTAFLAGLDKFFNLLTNWGVYLSPLATRLLPAGGNTLLHIIGPVEMLVGLAILTRWTRLGAYAASVWLLAVALAVLTTGSFFDIAVRDIVMSIAAFALASLTEARDTAGNTQISLSQLTLESSRGGVPLVSVTSGAWSDHSRNAEAPAKRG